MRLSQRPELAEGRLLVSEAAARLRREEVAPLMPNVILGVSEGDMASGHGSSFANLQDRFDLDAIATQRAGWGLFRDRRPELYGALLSADGVTSQA